MDPQTAETIKSIAIYGASAYVIVKSLGLGCNLLRTRIENKYFPNRVGVAKQLIADEKLSKYLDARASVGNSLMEKLSEGNSDLIRRIRTPEDFKKMVDSIVGDIGL